MNKLDEKDKQIIKEYLEKNKKDGKTDEEAIKEASAQTNLLGAFMFILVLTFIFAIFVLSGVEL
jgi:hypothetical protein